MFQPQSQWLIGSDGWAYNIDSSGLDHVPSKGENINILILDTEIYNNAWGQSSKASTASQVTKFESLGKTPHKQDLGSVAMSYGDVYVASVSLDARWIFEITKTNNANGIGSRNTSTFSSFDFSTTIKKVRRRKDKSLSKTRSLDDEWTMHTDLNFMSDVSSIHSCNVNSNSFITSISNNSNYNNGNNNVKSQRESFLSLKSADMNQVNWVFHHNGLDLIMWI